MKKTMKRIVCILLVIGMVLCGTVFASAEEPEIMAYMGDSMTFDFTGRYNLSDSMQDCIYPTLAANAMGYKLHPNMDHTIPVTSSDYTYFVPGGRTTEFYTLVSDYSGDDLSKGLGENLEYKAAYQQMIQETDVLTLQLGFSNITMYAFDNLLKLITTGDVAYTTDLSALANSEEMECVTEIISAVSDEIYERIGGEALSALKDYIAGLSDTEKAILSDVLGDTVTDILIGVSDTTKKVYDILVYAVCSYVLHFDSVIEELKALNPDLEIYVLGLWNPVQHLNLKFTVGAKEYVIPVGDIFGTVFDAMNLYAKVLSPHALEYYYVDSIESGDCFGTQMAEDEETVRQAIYWLLNGNLDGYEDTTSARYLEADSYAYGAMTAVKNTTTLDVNRLVEDLLNSTDLYLNLDLDIHNLDAVRDDKVNPDGTLQADYAEQFVAHIFMMCIAKGLYVHPTETTHAREAECLISAMQEKQVAKEAIAYHAGLSTLKTAFDKICSGYESLSELAGEKGLSALKTVSVKSFGTTGKSFIATGTNTETTDKSGETKKMIAGEAETFAGTVLTKAVSEQIQKAGSVLSDCFSLYEKAATFAESARDAFLSGCTAFSRMESRFPLSTVMKLK